MKATQLGDKNFGTSREFGCFQRLSITVITLLSIRLVVVESQVALRRPFVERFDCIGVRFAPLGVKCHMHLNTWYSVSIYKFYDMPLIYGVPIKSVACSTIVKILFNS